VTSLPSNWIEVPISALGTVITGSTPSTSDDTNWGGHIPFVTPGDMRHMAITTKTERSVTSQGAMRGRPLPEGAVLVTCIGNLGRTTIAGTRCLTNQQINSIVPFDPVSNRYIAYACSAPRFQRGLENASTSTTVALVNKSNFEKLTLPVAPVFEQRRIVAAIEEQFSRLDAGVAALERVRQNLKRMQAATIRLAVTGCLVNADPSEGSGQDLIREIENLAPKDPLPKRTPSADRHLVTDLPELPYHWGTAPWSLIGRSQNGRAFPSSDYTTEGVRLLRPGNLHGSGRVVWTTENTRHLPTRYADQFPDYVLRRDEIVMNLTAQSLNDEFLGRVCMTGHDGQVLLNQRIARLSPIAMNPRFVFWVLKSPVFRRFVDQLNTGSLIQHMFTSQLDQFVFPIPPLLEQSRIE
jgi:type I restriction enzyme, S subunit